MNAKIGIVTVLYHSDSVLEDFFKSISSQLYEHYMLYIVDNSVNEQSTHLIHTLLETYSLKEKVVYLPSSSNYGVAKGNNVGIKKALEDQCDYVLLSNNDIFFDDPMLFQKILKVHAEDQNKLIVSPKVYYYNSNLIWFAGCRFRKTVANPIHFGFQEEDKGQFDTPFYCNSGPTCFVLFHKSVFEKVGLMDEKYFVYMDDIDFFYRCQKEHIFNYYEPSIHIQHKESISTGGRGSDFTFKYTFRNRLYFIHKFYEFPLLIVSKLYLIAAYGLKAILQNRFVLLLDTYQDYRKLIKNEA
jgi:hypothetical protein